MVHPNVKLIRGFYSSFRKRGARGMAAFWGDRIASIMDPSEQVWTIATRIEETTEQERKDRCSDIQTKR